MKKKMLIIFGALLLLLSGCSKNGNASKLEGLSISELEPGFYIKSGDKFYKPMGAGLSSDSNGFYQWFTEPYDSLIPEYKKGDSLVYYSPSDRPSSYEFRRMIDYGYTIGMRFDLGKEGSGNWLDSDANQRVIKFSQSNYNEYSPIKDYISNNIKNIESTKITEINSKEIIPSMFSEGGFALGLTKDAFYKFNYYEGTVYSSINLKADTHVFIQEEDGIYRTTSYTEEKSSYFTVNMPSTMENGYYLVEGVGIFNYQANTE